MMESRPIPKWVEDRITELGGLNRFDKPNFIIVWGGSYTYKVGGMFKDVAYVKDSDGNPRAIVTRVAEVRTLLRFHPCRWHLLKWCPPEWYGDPEEWYQMTWDDEAQLHTMGDYPHHGDYEHVFYLGMCSHMGPKDKEWCNLCKVNCGEYIPLEENFYLIERQIQLLIASQGVNHLAQRSALFGREAERRQEYRKAVQERVEEALRPQLAVQGTSWQDGPHSLTPKGNTVNETILRRGGEGFRQGGIQRKGRIIMPD